MQMELAPGVIRRLAKELAALEANPPDGIKIEVEDNLSSVVAYIKGPEDTPFAEGVFKMKLQFTSDFPNAPPKGTFLTKIFHPNVSSPGGEICVNTLKKDYKPDLGIEHILLTVKSLLFQPNPESALNEEAGKLLLEDYASYAQRAALFTEIHATAYKNMFPSSGPAPPPSEGPLSDTTSGNVNIPSTKGANSPGKPVAGKPALTKKPTDVAKKSSLKRL